MVKCGLTDHERYLLALSIERRRKKCPWSGTTMIYGEVGTFMGDYDKETNRYACPGCDKPVKMRPLPSLPSRYAMIPRHNHSLKKE